MKFQSFRSLSWMSVLPVALVVALSLPACSSDTDKNVSSETNGTDPSCRPSTCATLGTNCGIVSDGCGGTLRCGTCAGSNNDCRQNVCERSCTSNNECPGGTACINGSCSDKCQSSQDCPSGQYCNAGSCVEKAPTTCSFDSDCRADERCLNGLCIGEVSNGRSCNRDSECRSAEACRNNRCTNVGARSCYNHSECRNDESCVNGYCSRDNGTAYCSSDYDCRGSEYCSRGVCRRNDSRRVRAECVTREIGLTLPFGEISFYSESWLYETNSSSGTRVESCLCQNGVMKLDLGETNRSISCSSCVKDGSVRTCFQ